MSPFGGCTASELAPQNWALEFKLLDQSSRVVRDSMPPSDGGIPIFK